MKGKNKKKKKTKKKKGSNKKKETRKRKGKKKRRKEKTPNVAVQNNRDRLTFIQPVKKKNNYSGLMEAKKCFIERLKRGV